MMRTILSVWVIFFFVSCSSDVLMRGDASGDENPKTEDEEETVQSSEIQALFMSEEEYKEIVEEAGANLEEEEEEYVPQYGTIGAGKVVDDECDEEHGDEGAEMTLLGKEGQVYHTKIGTWEVLWITYVNLLGNKIELWIKNSGGEDLNWVALPDKPYQVPWLEVRYNGEWYHVPEAGEDLFSGTTAPGCSTNIAVRLASDDKPGYYSANRVSQIKFSDGNGNERTLVVVLTVPSMQISKLGGKWKKTGKNKYEWGIAHTGYEKYEVLFSGGSAKAPLFWWISDTDFGDDEEPWFTAMKEGSVSLKAYPHYDLGDLTGSEATMTILSNGKPNKVTINVYVPPPEQ